MNLSKLLLVVSGALCGLSALNTEAKETMDTHQKATFGTGCFWCTEAVFERVDGVVDVTPGYSGGEVENPTYRQVCSGETGHAEVVQIEYDPGKVSFSDLLDVFWKAHDPTSLNRQGADVGTQYRSVIFYHDDEQKRLAEEAKEQLNDADVYGKPIVTEISPAHKFYQAEDYHLDYYRRNRNAPYCQFVITPKLKKLNMDQ